MIFQNAIDTLDQEILELQRQIESKNQRQNQLIELNLLTDSTLEGLTDVVSKIGHYAPDVIARLKAEVLALFDGFGDDDDDSSTQTYEEPPKDNPIADEWVLASGSALTGQSCAIDPDLYWDNAAPDGSSWELATPLACTVEFNPQPQKSTTELIHTSARTGYLKLKGSDRILAAYAWFSRKAEAEAWARQIEVIPSAKAEMRLSKRNSSWKWELKITGLSLGQIDRLSKEDLSRKPRKECASSKPPSYKQPERKLPVNPEEIEPGDIVTQLLTPSHSYRVEQIMPNGILDCINLTTNDRLGLRPTAVTLVQKARQETLLAS